MCICMDDSTGITVNVSIKSYCMEVKVYETRKFCTPYDWSF